MSHRYVVLGAGMQGTAAAYDLASFADAAEVVLADVDRSRAEKAAERVNALLTKPIVRSTAVDVQDAKSLERVLSGASACMSCVPYFFNVALTKAAIAARVHFNDLGGNTGVVQDQLAMDREAAAAGVSVIPDCGVAPGMANTLAAYGLLEIPGAKHVRMYCGGIPQNKALPLGYKLVFSAEGLTNEYSGEAVLLRGGEVRLVETLAELETIDFPEPIGRLEAFTTSGGSSTCPYTYQGRLETYQYKTLRYPGHLRAIRLFKDLGFFDREPIEIRGHKVVARDAFNALMDRVWRIPEEKDLLVLRVTVEGDGGRFIAQVIDRQDERTGFSAMERTTAFAAAVVTAMQARKQTPVGAKPVETGVEPRLFVEELKKRGIPLELTKE
jgi:lysine 6-dehydrogenase